MSLEHRANFMNLIWKERVRQDIKFPPEEGVNIDDTQMYIVLAEEFGEIARGLLDNNYCNVDDEIVQVAAVCTKWYELRREAELLKGFK
jgi:NTP pyrophosphatase (non-canonical NTP hydrolase)